MDWFTWLIALAFDRNNNDNTRLLNRFFDPRIRTQPIATLCCKRWRVFSSRAGAFSSNNKNASRTSKRMHHAIVLIVYNAIDISYFYIWNVFHFACACSNVDFVEEGTWKKALCCWKDGSRLITVAIVGCRLKSAYKLILELESSTYPWCTRRTAAAVLLIFSGICLRMVSRQWYHLQRLLSPAKTRLKESSKVFQYKGPCFLPSDTKRKKRTDLKEGIIAPVHKSVEAFLRFHQEFACHFSRWLNYPGKHPGLQH